jgi:hypothetical protein
MTNGPWWLPATSLLEPRPAGVSLGLHINLTEGRPLSRELARVWPRLPSLPRLVLAAHAGVLPRAALRAELQAQLAFFHIGTGALPQHVDGHQHVHHLPLVRELFLEMVAALSPAPLVRSTACLPGPGFLRKRWLIRHTGARGLARELVRRRLQHNSVLLGVYDFAQEDYGSWMRRWLARVPATGAWLFCHPGRAGSADDEDAIRAARLREWTYLAGDDFLRDLDAAGVGLASCAAPQANVQRLLIPNVSTTTSAVAST